MAITWVMVFHSFVVGGLGRDWAWLSRYGWMGVDLFFVLSGFLIGAQLFAPLAQGRRPSFRDFYVKRAFRILPAYLATLLLYWVWPGFREAPGMEPAWKFLSFTLNVASDYTHKAAFSHAWSLCVEEHFYAVFPLLAWALHRRLAPRGLAVLALAVLAGGLVLRGLLWQQGMASDPTMASRNWFIEDLYYPTWNRLDGLLCGVLLAAWKVFRPEAWQRARRHAGPAGLAGLCGMALAFWLFRDRVGLLGNTLGWPMLSMALALLVFAGAGRDAWLGRRALPGAGALAAVSYSLYLVHKPVYHLVRQQWGDALAGTGLLAFVSYGAAAILAGTALHLAVERPGLALRRRLLARRMPSAGLPAQRLGVQAHDEQAIGRLDG